MCRSKECGGRRCRGQGAEARRAYQRQWLASKRARLRAEQQARSEGVTPSLSLVPNPSAPEPTIAERAERSKAACARALGSREELYSRVDLNNFSEEWLRHEAVVLDAGRALDDELTARLSERSAAILAEMDEIQARLDAESLKVKSKIAKLREGAQQAAESGRFTLPAGDSFYMAEVVHYASEAGRADAKRLTELRAELASMGRDTLVEMMSAHREVGTVVPKYAPGSDRAGKKVADAAAKLLPSEWIAAADEHGRPLWIGGGNTRRAHYSSYSYHDKTEKRWTSDTLDLISAVPDDVAPYADWGGDSSDGLRLQPPDQMANPDADDPYADVEAALEAHNAKYAGRRDRRRPNLFRLNRDVDGPPRIEMQKRITISTPYAEITGSVGDPSTMLHEMGHRVEHMNAEIAELCETFLNRRAGGEEPSLIYEKVKGKPPEMGFKDGFATHYIGKQYGGAHTEVLSMGLEALFYGRYAGLKGNESYRADPEHRALILGMLATAGTLSAKEYKQLANDNTRANLDALRARERSEDRAAASPTNEDT